MGSMTGEMGQNLTREGLVPGAAPEVLVVSAEQTRPPDGQLESGVTPAEIWGGIGLVALTPQAETPQEPAPPGSTLSQNPLPKIEITITGLNTALGKYKAAYARESGLVASGSVRPDLDLEGRKKKSKLYTSWIKCPKCKELELPIDKVVFCPCPGAHLSKGHTDMPKAAEAA